MVACTGAVEPESARTTIERLTTATFSGTVAAEVSPAPSVIIRDRDGHPLAGIAVSFEVTGGKLVNQSLRTDAGGIASAGRWTLGTKAGDQLLTVRSAGVSPVSFTVNALPGPVAGMTPLAGNHQFGLAGSALPQPLRVSLADAFSNPVAGVPVVFTVVSGDGTIAGETAPTNAAGIATSGVWTLGARGAQRARARTESAAADFDALACTTITWGCDDPSDAQSVIVFVRGGHLFRAAAANAQPVQITNDAYDANPAWSPDGTRIAFTRYEKGRNSIYIMMAGGALARRTTDGNYYAPTWSLDGRRLAVVKHESRGLPGIYVMSADSLELPPVLLTEGYSPTWSPDGSRLAFVNGRSIYLVSADGSGVALLLTRNEDRGFNDVAWSPDGRRIAVTVIDRCNDDECDSSIGVLDAGATDIRVIVRSSGGHSAGQPAWSPDGSTIAFSSVACGLTGCSADVSAIRVDGTSERVIITNGGNPTWRR